MKYINYGLLMVGVLISEWLIYTVVGTWVELPPIDGVIVGLAVVLAVAITDNLDVRKQNEFIRNKLTKQLALRQHLETSLLELHNNLGHLGTVVDRHVGLISTKQPIMALDENIEYLIEQVVTQEMVEFSSGFDFLATSVNGKRGFRMQDYGTIWTFINEDKE